MQFKVGDKVMIRKDKLVRHGMSCHQPCNHCPGFTGMLYVIAIHPDNMVGDGRNINAGNAPTYGETTNHCSFRPDDLVLFKIQSWRKKLGGE